MARPQPSLFQALKPCCVALNDSLLRFQKKDTSPDDVIYRLDALYQVLDTHQHNDQLNARLADYVFFPVSRIFRDRARLPIKASETALRCLHILLRTGWSQIEDGNVAAQLLILLTFLAENKTSDTTKVQSSNELLNLALVCLADLFDAIKDSIACKQHVLDTSNVPAVGHAVTIMLDRLRDGKDSGIQLTAVATLGQFVKHVATPDLLETFFPGIVSTLVHVLTSVSNRASYKTMQRCLRLFQDLIVTVMSDVRTRGPRADALSEKQISENQRAPAQLKRALTSVARLSVHNRAEVRTALRELCFAILRGCRTSLPDCCSVAFETTVSLSLRDDDAKTTEELRMLISTEEDVAEIARSAIYDWLVALARMLTSKDEQAKVDHVRKILLIRRHLDDADVDLSVIDDMLSANLVDGLHSQSQISEGYGELSQGNTVDLLISKSSQPPININNLAVISGANEPVLTQVQALVQHLATTSGGMRMAQTFLDNTHSTQGELRVVNFWLCLSMLQTKDEHDADTEDLIDFSSFPSDQVAIRDEVYNLALDILSTNEDGPEPEPRLQTLALQAISLQAHRMGLAFRPELVDSLYPVVHLMGSSQAFLQQRALASLDKIASATGYSSSREMLVGNVDYLVNAISLKLNSYDISPQAPQVLLMMTKLCGAKLLPYLEDLVDSTFDALEHFHGYPKLVQLLFSMLEGVVEEGSKAPAFAIEAPDRPSNQKAKKRPMTIEDAASSIKASRQRVDNFIQCSKERPDDQLPEATPQRPWKELRTFDEELATVERKRGRDGKHDSKDDDESEDGNEGTPDDPPEDSAELTAPALTKTYGMIQRIASLTQHHLPSSSSSIRTLLLSLLSRAMPYLSKHDDSFLPLINTLWPVLVPRLLDPEAFVVAGVLDVMACLCEGAGDFMSSRVELLWPTVCRVWKQTDDAMKQRPNNNRHSKQRAFGNQNATNSIRLGTGSDLAIKASSESDALTPSRSSAEGPWSMTPHQGRYVPTTALTVNAALVRFLISICQHVRIPENIYSDMLNEMLYEALVSRHRKDVQEALAAINQDAVWLVLERFRLKGKAREVRVNIRERARPTDLEGMRFAVVY